MKCQRGDLSFIFNGDAPPSQSFVVLDNEAKVYQRIHHEVSRPRLTHVCVCLCVCFEPDSLSSPSLRLHHQGV